MNPAFLLDSSVCVQVLRNRADLGNLPSPAESGIPIIVAAELWTGVKKTSKLIRTKRIGFKLSSISFGLRSSTWMQRYITPTSALNWRQSGSRSGRWIS